MEALPDDDLDDLFGGASDNNDDEPNENLNEIEPDEEQPRDDEAIEAPGRKKRAAPKISKNPRIKLDPARLTGDRGITELPKIFENFSFKGKGHEKEDLDKLLMKLEHWGHRLFPKMPFDNLLAHIEKLGTKRPVQGCVRRLRLGMPADTDDYVNRENNEDDIENEIPEEPNSIDPFEELLQSSNLATTNDTLPPMETSVIDSEPQTVTEEMKERMERNRRLAEEKRRLRLQAMQNINIDASTSLDTSSSHMQVDSETASETV